MSAYLQELRAQWRPLLAATLGMSSGHSIISYVTSITAPHMLKEFGWSKSEFAAVGSLGIVALFVFPLIGRLADLIGVRKTALIGVAFFPFAYAMLAFQSGSLRVYVILYVLMALLCTTTTATVYSRVVVQYVKGARGLALAIVASGPAIMGIAFAPLLNNFVDAQGWRAGYGVMATFSGLVGAAALLLIPAATRKVGEVIPKRRTAKEDYGLIVRNRAFWILAGAMLLCNLPQVIALTQLNLLLIDNGVTATGVSAMISAFATGILAGRFACGIALDRFPPHLVAAIGMALSSLGLFIIASGHNDMAVLVIAVMLVGLSFGAEGDLVSFLVVRCFGVSVYGTVMGLMTAIISISVSGGAIVLSILLARTGSSSPFFNSAASRYF